MSLRDKINNKFNKPKQQQIFPFQSFDETSINITLFGGQSQLCPIKLNCAWNDNVVYRSPELSCRWYNRTETSLNEIEGITGSYYQPSLRDVGSIIHIQCVPVLEGEQYEGMPLIKDVGPIKVDPQTQQQANDLFQAEKATFFIKIKQIKQKESQNEVIHEGLIKIVKSTFRLISRYNEQETTIMQVSMSDNQPMLQSSRINPKQLTIFKKAEDQSEYVKVQFSNNKVRDVLCLVSKFIVAHHPQNKEQLSEEQELNKTQTTVVEEVSVQEKTTEEKIELKNNEEEKNSKEEKKQEGEGKQEKQVKSSQELVNLKKGISSPSKKGKNANQFMEITELKKQVRENESEKNKLNKIIGEKNDVIEELKGKINEHKEREQNLSKNYFQLEQQLNKITNDRGKVSEEMSFYQNEYRILKEQQSNSEKKIKELLSLNDELTEKLQHFSEEEYTYSELKEKYSNEVYRNKQLEDRYEFIVHENHKKQEEYSGIKERLSELEDQNKYYQKKYQSISQQLQFSIQSPLLNHNQSSISNRSMNKSVEMESSHSGNNNRINDREEKMEKQILQLKRQLKDIVEENNYLRTLNVKEKKSSKSQLKAQMVQLRKLANRLAETVTEKELALQQMRKINKQLNERIIELGKFQYQNQQLPKPQVKQ